MKKYQKSSLFCLVLLLGLLMISCKGIPKPISEVEEQIGQYIVEIFEDSKGNLWFGTMGKGVARFDGENLTYYSIKDGLFSNAVVDIIEDKNGILWFATHMGLSKFNPSAKAGKMFTNYTENDGLIHFRVSNLLIDSKENFWIGTWGGVSLYTDTGFVDFPLPVPDIEVPSYQETEEWVTEIMEDREGNIWFSRSGYAVCKYNPSFGNFTEFTKKDGLASNCVQTIIEDSHGNFWFTSRVAEKDHPEPAKRVGDGGLNRLNFTQSEENGGKLFTHFPDLEGLSENDVYFIHEDKSGVIWIGAIGVGLYSYDGGKFTLYNKADLEESDRFRFGIQSVLEDSKGTFWFGGSGGLFQMKDSVLINITQGDFKN